jgi:hypothetical protein
MSLLQGERGWRLCLCSAHMVKIFELACPREVTPLPSSAFPHSTELRGGGCTRSAKAARGEDLQIEHPVSCGDSPAFHFHATLTGVLGSALIRDEVVQVCEPRQKRLLAPLRMMEPFHRVVYLYRADNSHT